jgi:hypothetical protein
LNYSGIGPDGLPYTANNAIPFYTSNTNPMRASLLQDDNNNEFRFQGSVALNYKMAKDWIFRTAQNIYYRNGERLQPVHQTPRDLKL